MSHTILLIQPTVRHDSRSWTDFESVTECIEGVCTIFEENLKKLNPDSASITYDVQNLFDFIDRLADLSCLVWQSDLEAYTAHNKEWIKEQIYSLLRKQASITP
ncbi:Enhancer of rudimentary -like protein [Toxocara canis]|uniref:Enhancer of rudimentary homolog n=2 Tax=Toxocara canis TaxID=6265 RepID=A0A0B2VSF8_TOXCA|nr:Enhancer of rudimentary -like protein [Toxocara canis]VDM44375.1 unnamed protein product [Toxocara canis]